MADWAGAYGAGAASAALEDLIARQFLERKQAEMERATRAREQAEAAQMAQRGDEFRQVQALRMQDFVADRDARYEDQLGRKADREADLSEREKDRKLRADERKQDLEARNAEREDEQAFRSQERKSREAFERSLMGMRSGGPANEPLESVVDPQTGRPKLVPRSQAAGMTPASTRDQALTEGQSNAAGFTDRMRFNEQAIQGYETSAADRLSAVGNFFLPRDFQSSERQAYEAAKRNWMAAQLRKESGAAISQGEYDEADRQYFPQPGDSPEVVKQKRELRRLAQESMSRASGSAGAGAGGGAKPMTRTIRNRQTGETRTQVSIDGGATWN